MTLITTNTPSGAASSSFTSSIDSTYKLYIFKFYNIHLATDNARFQFNLSIDAGSNYNVAKISTSFRAQHAEDDASAALNYDAAFDLPTGADSAGVTNDQPLADSGNDNDQAIAGELYLFNPASTTYVKHFYSQTNASRLTDFTQTYFIGGYANVTDNIDAITFKTSTGNIDAGTIQMYGVG